MTPPTGWRRLHHGNREGWVTELRGEDVDDLEPSALDPAGGRWPSPHRATDLGTAQDLADRLLGADHNCAACEAWHEVKS